MRKYQLMLICFLALSLAAISSGCAMLQGLGGIFTPSLKPDVGPTGKPVETKPNPPVPHRFWSPPVQLYDLEATAGVIFEGINKEKWDQAMAGLTNLQTIWDQAKPLIGDMKGVTAGDQSLAKLTAAINSNDGAAAYESLIAFMAAISEIGKSFKLSPLSDIVAVGNTARNVAFYAEDKNWSKATAKVKELQGTWQQVKPSMEQVGILGELTKTHATVKQLKDAVTAENKNAVADNMENLNESMGRIRMFYYGR